MNIELVEERFNETEFFSNNIYPYLRYYSYYRLVKCTKRFTSRLLNNELKCINVRSVLEF